MCHQCKNHLCCDVCGRWKRKISSWVQLRRLHLHLFFSSARRFLANLCVFFGGECVFSSSDHAHRPKAPNSGSWHFEISKKGGDFSSSSLARFAHLFHNFSEVARTQTSNHRSSFVSDNVKVHCPVQTKCRKKEHNFLDGKFRAATRQSCPQR